MNVISKKCPGSTDSFKVTTLKNLCKYSFKGKAMLHQCEIWKFLVQVFLINVCTESGSGNTRVRTTKTILIVPSFSILSDI